MTRYTYFVAFSSPPSRGFMPLRRPRDPSPSHTSPHRHSALPSRRLRALPSRRLRAHPSKDAFAHTPQRRTTGSACYSCCCARATGVSHTVLGFAFTGELLGALWPDGGRQSRATEAYVVLQGSLPPVHPTPLPPSITPSLPAFPPSALPHILHHSLPSCFRPPALTLFPLPALLPSRQPRYVPFVADVHSP
ncbi:unnamed protein product [Closterium sp. Naga37s-1]|nr:unnamed protein product [Closterium sp. Naga37s-1]